MPLLSAAGLAALAPVAARAQARWQMATPYADGNFHTRNIRTFLQEIEQAAGGRLSVQLHSNGSLLRMPEIKRGVQTGQVQLGEILLTAYANEDPLFDADALPQLVTNFAQAKQLSDLQKPFIEARLARQGLTPAVHGALAAGGALRAAAGDLARAAARAALPHLLADDQPLRAADRRAADAGAVGGTGAGLRHRRGAGADHLGGDRRRYARPGTMRGCSRRSASR